MLSKKQIKTVFFQVLAIARLVNFWRISQNLKICSHCCQKWGKVSLWHLQSLGLYRLEHYWKILYKHESSYCWYSTGTFSNVYLAKMNRLPDELCALKHIIPTSGPGRVENELKCLQDIGYELHQSVFVLSVLAEVRVAYGYLFHFNQLACNFLVQGHNLNPFLKIEIRHTNNIYKTVIKNFSFREP